MEIQLPEKKDQIGSTCERAEICEAACSSGESLVSLVQHYWSAVLKVTKALTVAHTVFRGRKLHVSKSFLECVCFCKEAMAFSINNPFLFSITTILLYISCLWSCPHCLWQWSSNSDRHKEEELSVPSGNWESWRNTLLYLLLFLAWYKPSELGQAEITLLMRELWLYWTLRETSPCICQEV